MNGIWHVAEAQSWCIPLSTEEVRLLKRAATEALIQDPEWHWLSSQETETLIGVLMRLDLCAWTPAQQAEFCELWTRLRRSGLGDSGQGDS